MIKNKQLILLKKIFDILSIKGENVKDYDYKYFNYSLEKKICVVIYPEKNNLNNLKFVDNIDNLDSHLVLGLSRKDVHIVSIKNFKIPDKIFDKLSKLSKGVLRSYVIGLLPEYWFKAYIDEVEEGERDPDSMTLEELVIERTKTALDGMYFELIGGDEISLSLIRYDYLYKLFRRVTYVELKAKDNETTHHLRCGNYNLIVNIFDLKVKIKVFTEGEDDENSNTFIFQLKERYEETEDDNNI